MYVCNVPMVPVSQKCTEGCVEELGAKIRTQYYGRGHINSVNSKVTTWKTIRQIIIHVCREEVSDGVS